MHVRWLAVTGLVAGCTIPNPAFDGTNGEGDTEAVTTSVSTSGPGPGSQTSPDPTDPGRTESGDDTLPTTTDAMTSDTGVDPGDGSSSEALPECPIRQLPEMTFEVAELCDGKPTFQHGFLHKVGPGKWTFDVCPTSECPEEPISCNAKWTLTFGPSGVEPPEHLDGQCVQIAFEMEGNGINDPCRPRWLTIKADEGGRPLYMAGWSLPDAGMDAPFEKIVAEPKCHCAGYAVECCATASDPGPQFLQVTPADGGPAFAVFMGQQHPFDVHWQQAIVRYEFGNHRSLRASCDEAPIHEWFLRDAPDP